MRANIFEKTGVAVSVWIKRIKAAGLDRHAATVAWLKTEHGLTHGYANFIALEAQDAGNSPKPKDPVAALFAGRKGGLKPLYDGIVRAMKEFGEDLEIAPKRANVSLRRKKQFALLQPSTPERLDVGLILKSVRPGGRLEASGSFSAMFTHRVRVASMSDVDDQLKLWLKQAYDAAG